MKLVAVGEAYGRREAQFKHPLVGPTGRELSLMMGQSGLAPYMTLKCRKCGKLPRYLGVPSRCEFCNEHIWPNEFHLIDHWTRLRHDYEIAVTNVFNERPPDNDLGHFFDVYRETDMPPWKASKKTPGTHLKATYKFHIERLHREIKDWKPNLVLAMGNAACWAILGQTKITMLRGTVTLSDWLNVKVLPTFHPANILRNPAMRPTVLADLQKATREVQFPDIQRKHRYFNIPDPDETGIEQIYRWFQTAARAYACDIETIRTQISIIGFAKSAEQALVIPFRNIDLTNYWPTKELEFQAWKAVMHGLQTPQPKIFQNGLFDLYHLCRMGIHTKNVGHDTMLWHHSEYPELPKSLGYLGSLYSDEIAWKILRTQGTLKRDE